MEFSEQTRFSFGCSYCNLASIRISGFRKGYSGSGRLFLLGGESCGNERKCTG